MKRLPDWITLSRIAFSLSLPFVMEHKLAFLLIYLYCGLSDAADGWLARRMGTASDRGALLDSASDLVFFAAVLFFLFSQPYGEFSRYLPWVLAAGLLRGVGIALAAWKYRTFAILHTWGNKLTGLLLFLAPLFLQFRIEAALWLACAVAVLASAEELAIHLTSRELSRDRRGLWG